MLAPLLSILAVITSDFVSFFVVVSAPPLLAATAAANVVVIVMNLNNNSYDSLLDGLESELNYSQDRLYH